MAPITKTLLALTVAALASAQPLAGQNEIEIQGYGNGVDNCNGAGQPLNLRANECQQIADDLRRFGGGGGFGGEEGCVFFFNNPQCEDEQELGRFTPGDGCVDPLANLGGANGGEFGDGFGNGPNGACYSPSCDAAECGRAGAYKKKH